MRTLLAARVALAGAALVCTVTVVAGYTPVGDWLKLPAGRPQLGNMHGDVAVSSKGEVFVSVQDPTAGVQVYAPDGTFLRNVTGAPSDFHGFVIRTQPDGEFLYGATLRGQTIVKMKLDGTIVMTIGSSAVPDEFKVRNARSNELQLLLTGLDVAPNGDIYVADGYASDYIHRFDKTGKYLASFGGKKAPYNFNTLHKLAIDTRFQPTRIIGVDRANNRVVHLSLIRRVPRRGRLGSAAAGRHHANGDTVVVGELRGRVTVLDKAGKVVERIGENAGEGVGTNQARPEAWRPGLLLSPHGVAINARAICSCRNSISTAASTASIANSWRTSMLSLGIALLSAAAAAAPVTTCESLQSMSTPQVAVTAESTAAGPFVAPGAAPAAAPAPAAGARTRGWCPRGSTATAGALPREAGAAADRRLEDQRRALAADRRAGTAASWRWATAGSAGRSRASARCRPRCGSATRRPAATPGTTKPPRVRAGCSRWGIPRRSWTSPTAPCTR